METLHLNIAHMNDKECKYSHALSSLDGNKCFHLQSELSAHNTSAKLTILLDSFILTGYSSGVQYEFDVNNNCHQ